MCGHQLPTPSSCCCCVYTSKWLVVVRYKTSVSSGLTSSGAHTPISIDSHPTLEDINKFIVREVPSSATISIAPTTDGKQLPSVTIAKIHPDKPLVPIPKVAADWKQVAIFLDVKFSVIQIADTDHRRCGMYRHL